MPATCRSPASGAPCRSGSGRPSGRCGYGRACAHWSGCASGRSESLAKMTPVEFCRKLGASPRPTPGSLEYSNRLQHGGSGVRMAPLMLFIPPTPSSTSPERARKAPRWSSRPPLGGRCASIARSGRARSGRARSPNKARRLGEPSGPAATEVPVEDNSCSGRRAVLPRPSGRRRPALPGEAAAAAAGLGAAPRMRRPCSGCSAGPASPLGSRDAPPGRHPGQRRAGVPGRWQPAGRRGLAGASSRSSTRPRPDGRGRRAQWHRGHFRGPDAGRLARAGATEALAVLLAQGGPVAAELLGSIWKRRPAGLIRSLPPGFHRLRMPCRRPPGTSPQRRCRLCPCRGRGEAEASARTGTGVPRPRMPDHRRLTWIGGSGAPVRPGHPRLLGYGRRRRLEIGPTPTLLVTGGQLRRPPPEAKRPHEPDAGEQQARTPPPGSRLGGPRPDCRRARSGHQQDAADQRSDAAPTIRRVRRLRS